MQLLEKQEQHILAPLKRYLWRFVFVYEQLAYISSIIFILPDNKVRKTVMKSSYTASSSVVRSLLSSLIDYEMNIKDLGSVKSFKFHCKNAKKPNYVIHKAQGLHEPKFFAL